MGLRRVEEVESFFFSIRKELHVRVVHSREDKESNRVKTDTTSRDWLHETDQRYKDTTANTGAEDNFWPMSSVVFFL